MRITDIKQEVRNPIASPEVLSRGHMVFECEKVRDGGCGYEAFAVRPGTRFVVAASQLMVPYESKYTSKTGISACVRVSDMGLCSAMHETRPYIPRNEIALLRREVWRADRFTERVQGRVRERSLSSGFDPRYMYVRPRMRLAVRHSYRGNTKQTSFWKARYWQTDDVPSRYPVTIRSGEMPGEDLGAIRFNSAWRDRWSDKPKSVEHSIPTPAISVTPESVLLWDADKSRVNSRKRLAYMLGIRVIPHAFSIDRFSESLDRAISEAGLEIPRKRMESILMLAGRYQSPDGPRRHTTGPLARTLAYYQPPEGAAFDALRQLLQEEHDIQVAVKAA